MRFITLLLVAAVPQEPPLVAKSEPLTAAEQHKRFHLPPGFKIELVAAEPDIHKPMNLAFDDQGRLLATSSIEYPFPAKPGAPPRDALKRIEDTDGDGRPDKVVPLAEGLNIPIGLTPLPNGALVHSIPKIWRVIDGKLEPLYGDFGFNDTHGMASSFTPWLDGWIYATHGFSNTSNLRGADGHAFTLRSGNTFRMRADGSRIEQFTHGQVNPFGLCFDPLGNLYSSDCHTKPAYQLLRGGWYPSFGSASDGLGLAPDMMSHLHGSTGNCGIVYYAATHFPAEYRDTILICNPVTGRINHDRLEARGSTYRAIEQPDFLRCDDPWFRPVDLKLAPDGSLYVADFYNRIIGHYEVPLTHPGRDRERGRIWRITWTGEKPRPMADLAKASPDELVALLKDDNFAVRVKATNRLAAAEPVLKLLAGESHPWQRAHGLWVLDRTGKLEEPIVRQLASDPDRAVRIHLLKALGERKEWKDLHGLVRDRLKDADAFVRRAAAEALGLHPHPENIKPLLDLWESTDAKDTHLVHMARMALRDQLAAPGGFEEAQHNDNAPLLVNVSLGVHTPESAAFVFPHLRRGGAVELHHVARYIAAASLPAVYARANTPETLRAIHQAAQERGLKLPEEVAARALPHVLALLSKDDRKSVTDGIALARDLRLKGAFDELVKLVGGRLKIPEVRAAAIDALASFNTAEARTALVNALRSAPTASAVAIAGSLAATKEGGELLLAEAAAGRVSPRVLLDKNVAGRLKAAGLAERATALAKDLPPEDDRLRQLIESRRAAFGKSKSDAARGAEVYKKNCAGCHRIGNAGNKVGPELDGIGIRGLERLLEDVLDPNRNVDQAFRATIVKTTDGRVVSGLVLREEGQTLVLVEAADKETRIPLKEIDQRALSQLSAMPSNVADIVAEPDFFDLVSYLLSQRK